MIRVMYWWKVEPGQEDAFAAAWSQVTRWIREHKPGARGSLLLRSAEDPHEFVAIARWTSREAWEASPQLDDAEMQVHRQTMRTTAERSRPAVFFEEVADLTVSDEERAGEA
ncbi:antibiotic biosynthesis monooxygenase family protein [Nannocystis bainbridge]|uniref:Antibiotic biosynthesis monooxygenase n=1 Tax=Nannocystis bainbridge TaxID=2995303 RepID=A0ABT5EBU2_9BACT|nr:antibiotic biosynthesis monooxygenase family protein [Nannocystis bainbridge]MDC0722908.1 antibiotic biosynthesis monooxygenase [Nannocystis bainbridge]